MKVLAYFIDDMDSGLAKRVKPNLVPEHIKQQVEHILNSETKNIDRIFIGSWIVTVKSL